MIIASRHIYWKDSPDEIITRDFGILEADDVLEDIENSDIDEAIFFYVYSEDELEQLKNEDNGEEFVIVSDKITLNQFANKLGIPITHL